MIFQKINRLFVFSLIALIISNCSQPQQIIPTETQQPKNTSTPTQEPTATITPTPLPEFDICTLDNFRDCEITEAELLEGDYFVWLKEVIAPTLVPVFQERYLGGAMLYEVVPNAPHSFGQATYYAFPLQISFAAEATRPFMRYVTFAWSPYERPMAERPDDAPDVGYFVSPVFMYEVTNTESGEGIVHPIILIYLATEDMLPELIRKYKVVNEPVFYSTTNYAAGIVDPLVFDAFEWINSNSDQKMEDRFTAFSTGDYGALSEPGIMLNTSFLTDSGWYTD